MRDATEFHLSLSPFRQVVKDYWQICESYYDAVKNLPPSKIEAIDMARRGIHNEGARILEERLEGKAEVDTDTARRLFTLICVLHFGGLRGQVTQNFPQSVLFCCDHNATRSPMAEGLMKRFYGHRAYVQSAGVKKRSGDRRLRRCRLRRDGRGAGTPPGAQFRRDAGMGATTSRAST